MALFNIEVVLMLKCVFAVDASTYVYYHTVFVVHYILVHTDCDYLFCLHITHDIRLGAVMQYSFEIGHSVAVC